MKIEDLRKTNQALKGEIKKNNDQIIKCAERIRMVKANQFEFKVIQTLFYSILPYTGVPTLLAILVKNGVITSIKGLIPIESLLFIVAGGSLGLGIIGTKLVNSKYKTKERLRSFTTAKSQSEKLYQKVKYTIELEKTKNRNKAIEQTIEILNSLASRYDILPQTKEESKKNFEEISLNLKRKYDELDILTTQKVLNEKFDVARNKKQKVINTVVLGFLGGVLTMVLNMPLVMLRDFLLYPNANPILAPLILGVIGVSGYMIKRNKDYEKTFNILNSELGANALSDEIEETYEKQDVDTKIESKIKEISIDEIQLQEQKRIIESFIDNNNEKETINKEIIKENNLENLISSMEFYSEMEEPQIQEKNSSLVLKRKLNNIQK